MKTLKLSLLYALLSCFFLVAQAHSETTDTYELSQAELDQILAPIALYPDTILSHVLIAATYPLEVIQAERWTRENPSLNGEAALKAVENQDWDPSVKALVPFPQILQKMSENLDWMQKLGDAFLQNEEMVLATVQELRQRAYKEGSLDDFEHVKVNHDNDHIVIEPAVREVVYVPYYDTRVVYGPWWWVDYPPIYWAHHHHHYHPGAYVYWGPRVHVGVGFGFYFSSVHWHNRHIVVVDRHYARRHHFYSGRQVVRHDHSRRWVHNTRHRRGVEYRHPHFRQETRANVARSDRNADYVSRRLQQDHSRSRGDRGDNDYSSRHHPGERGVASNNNAARTNNPRVSNDNSEVRSRHDTNSSNDSSSNDSKWNRVQNTRQNERATPPTRGEASPRETTPRQVAPRQIAPRESTPRETAPRQIAPRETAPRQTESYNRQAITNRHSTERQTSAPARTYTTNSNDSNRSVERSDSSRGSYRSSGNDSSRGSAMRQPRSTNHSNTNRSSSSRHERTQR